MQFGVGLSLPSVNGLRAWVPGSWTGRIFCCLFFFHFQAHVRLSLATTFSLFGPLAGGRFSIACVRASRASSAFRCFVPKSFSLRRPVLMSPPLIRCGLTRGLSTNDTTFLCLVIITSMRWHGDIVDACMQLSDTEITSKTKKKLYVLIYVFEIALTVKLLPRAS